MKKSFLIGVHALLFVLFCTVINIKSANAYYCLCGDTINPYCQDMGNSDNQICDENQCSQSWGLFKGKVAGGPYDDVTKCESEKSNLLSAPIFCQFGNKDSLEISCIDIKSAKCGTGLIEKCPSFCNGLSLSYAGPDSGVNGYSSKSECEKAIKDKTIYCIDGKTCVPYLSDNGKCSYGAKSYSSKEECEKAINAKKATCCCQTSDGVYAQYESATENSCEVNSAVTGCEIIKPGQKCGTSGTVDSPRSADPLSIKLGRGEDLNPNDLNDLNPLSRSTNDFKNEAGRKPGNIVSRLVRNVVFPASGLLLFLYLVWGGFQVVSGATMGNDNTINAGKQRVTAAIVGFLLLFASYWLWSLVETAMGLGGTTS